MLPANPTLIPYRRQQLSPLWRARTQFWDEPRWNTWRIQTINRLLRRHKVASQRELEARLSDFLPPGTPWVFPHDITSLKRTHDIVEVSNDPVPFYTRRNMPRMYYEPVLQTKQAINRGYNDICAQETCGDIGEQVVFKSMQAAKNLALKPHTLGNVKEINGHRTDGTLDTYGYVTSPQDNTLRTARPLGVEVKNVRHFVYPDSSDIWQTLRCAVELQCLPVLTTRRVHFKTFLFCRSIGMIVHESQKQYFAASLSEDPRLLAAHEDLNFLDVIAWEEADPFIVQFFEETVPKIIDRTASTFERYSDLIGDYAIAGDLHNDEMPPVERKKRFAGFKEEFIRLSGIAKPW